VALAAHLQLGKPGLALEQAANAPSLAILGTEADGRGPWLAAGQALQRVLLEATVGGFRCSFLNQPIRQPELRAAVQRLAGGEGCPQVLIRLGRGAEPEVTPRRPLTDVLA
jgi:hypothetical protein